MSVLKKWMTASATVPAGHRILSDYQSEAAGGVVDRQTAEAMVPPGLMELLEKYNAKYAGTVEISHATLRADGSLEDVWLSGKGDGPRHSTNLGVLRDFQVTPNGFSMQTHFGGTQHYKTDEAGKLVGVGYASAESNSRPYFQTRETIASDGRDPTRYGDAEYRFTDKACWGLTHGRTLTRIDWPARTEQRLTLIGKALVGFAGAKDPTKPSSPRLTRKALTANA